MSSKTRCLVSLLAIVTFGSATAASAAPVVAGLKLGYTRTDLAGQNSGNVTGKNGAVLGVIFGCQVNPWFSVQVDPAFTQKGAEIPNWETGDLPASLRLDYLEIPVLAKFKYAMPAAAQSGLFGTVGPTFGFNTHDKLEVRGAQENVNQGINGFDFGLAVGAGYDIVTGPGIATFDVRYVIGLTDIFKSTAPSAVTTGDYKNRALQITVGWFKRVD